MNNSFIDGFEHSAQIRSEILGANLSSDYIQQVSDSIDQANVVMGELNESNLLIDSLKGFVAERWHSETFNIDAALNGSNEKVIFTELNKFASPDIISSWGDKFGLKYYNFAEGTAKAQSMSFEDYYRKATYGKPVKPTIEEFYAQRNILDIESKQHQSIYQTQTRIVPSDQYGDIWDALHRNALREKLIRPELVDKYTETHQNLADRINSPEGNSSIPLSEEKAKEIARDLKQGEYDGKKHGLDTTEMVKFEHIVNEAIKAGLTAAVITTVINGIPNIIIFIEKALKQEDITLADFIERGFGSLSASTQSFIRGSLAATLSATFKSGHAGEYAKNLSPTIIGVITAVTLNIVESSIKLAQRKITTTEFSNECFKNILVGSLAGIGSIALQAILPVPILGLLVGSLIGSMVGAFTYSASSKLILKLGSESGLTYFHLIEQDYSLPNDILEFMGLKVLSGSINKPKINRPIIDKPFTTPPIINKPKLDLPYIISRDIIGINKIGYLIAR